MRGCFAILFLLCGGLSPLAAGTELVGQISLPDGLSTPHDSLIVICRDQQEIAVSAANADGSFAIEQPDDSKPFDLIILPRTFVPVVVKNVIEINQTLTVELQVKPLKNVATDSSEEYANQIRSAFRSIEDARELLPQKEEYLQRLDSVQEIVVRQKELSLLVPAYFHPATARDDWKRLHSLADQLKDNLIVILNVNSGSGMNSGVETLYQSEAKKLKAKKARWIGYVNVDYGNRPVDQVIADIQFWNANYPGMCGIFADQSPSAGTQDLNVICQQARQLLKKAGINDPIIMANPGTACQPSLAGEDAFSWVCINENPVTNARFEYPLWADMVKGGVSLGTIVYDVKSPDQARKIVSTTAGQRGEFLYVSDQDGRNQVLWTRLPDETILKPVVSSLADWNKTIRAAEPVKKKK